MYKIFIKRIIDVIISLFGIIIFFPILLLITITLFFVNRGKPFFFQERPGKNAKIFRIIKFKTMNDKKDNFGNFLPDEFRITKMGNFIRKTSFDEVTQLFNVLIGDMSLVGPRPLLIQYLPLYNESQARRHEVRPGITGWAQVNGRNAISWNDKFKYDVWYVDNISFLLDFKILLLTIKKVFKRDGINQIGHVSSTVFTGNPEE